MAEQQITVQDGLWLDMDRPNNLMIIDGVMWFLSSPDWEAAKGVIEERLIKRFPVFSSVPEVRSDGRYWVPDPKFSLDNHIFMPDLPAPVSLAAVQEYVSQERSKPLSKKKPLWEFHFIDNVVADDGRTGAVAMARFHHSIADGVRLVQVMFGLCDPIEGGAQVAAAVGKGRSLDSSGDSGEGARDKIVAAASELGGKAAVKGAGALESLKATVEVAKQAGPPAAAGLANKLSAAAADPAGAARALTGTLATAPGQLSQALGGTSLVNDAMGVAANPGRLVDAVSTLAPLPEEIPNTVTELVKLAIAPPSVKTAWSGTPGTAKSVHWVDSIRLDRVKEVGQKTGTTVNDVIISVVAGTMQAYLAEHGQPVDDVMWFVPVSLKPFDPSMPKELGNHFAVVPLTMPLGIADPRDRLLEIKARIDKIKKSHEPVVTFGIQRMVAQSPERISVFLTNYLANKGVGVLTNVPGPSGQISFAGTPVEGILGWAPASGDNPMTVTIFSYNGRVHVGMAVDKKLIPDGGRLPELFGDVARELYKAVTGKDAEHDEHPILA